MAGEVDRKGARKWHAGFGQLPPGVLMVTLWFIGMVLFSSLALTLHMVAWVLVRLYAGG